MDFDLKKYSLFIIGVVLLISLVFSGAVSAMTIDDLQNEIDMGNDVFLTDEITIYHDILNDPVILDLKGHTVTAAEGKRHFVVNRGELRLVDSVGGGKLDGNNVGGGVKVVGDMAWTSTFNMQSGMITHCVAASGGAVECIVNGCFIMSGGKIFSCQATADNQLYSGGGAISLGIGSGNMFGGEITSCSAAKGGAVYISQNSRFSMYDGTLSHCRDNGGDEHEQDGVYTEQGMGSVGAIINSPGNFEFKGGNIVDCGKDAILIVDYGNCGANLTWELTDDGTLTISGTGAMYDYSLLNIPWSSYRSNMTTLVLPNGLTTIGDSAFWGCRNFTGSLTIPNSVISIGDSAFCCCSGLTSVTVPSSVTTIGDCAFIFLDSKSIIYAGCDVSLLSDKYSGYATALAANCANNAYTFTVNQSLLLSPFPLTADNAPVKEGKTFEGWYANPSYTGEKVTSVANGSTLYAKWSGGADGLQLYAGWNVISTPKKLSSAYDTAAELFAGVNTTGHAILSYNCSTKSWEQITASTKITPLNAYWIYSNESKTLPYEFSSSVSSPAVKNVYKGWNAVGLSADEPLSASLTFGNTNWYTYLEWNASTQGFKKPIIKGGTGEYADTNLVSLWTGGWLFLNEDGTYMGFTA